MDEVYKYKFLERLEAAKIEREKAFYHSSVSNLYFAVFNYMQGIIGEPPQGRWKHGSITKPFAKVCYEKGIYNTTTLREFINRYEELYRYRVYSDYKRHIFTNMEKAEIEKIFDFFLGVFRYG